MNSKWILFASVLVATFAVSAVTQGVGNGLDARYATDAYPGFDLEETNTKPEKKEPRLLSFLFGPKMASTSEQFAWAAQLESEGSLSSARKAYDALVREWPAAPEAWKAQLKVAELLTAERDYEESFKEYRYLLDFYSTFCDFTAVCREMYKLAELMREEGKTIIFFNFRNTVDVRRAYESLVLRAPGAPFVPKAMLTIASLREDEDQLPEAIAVYENLRNLYPDGEAAVEAAYREARLRMEQIRRHGYNRNRVNDTIEYLRLVLASGAMSADRQAELRSWQTEAEGMLEAEAWKAAQFYDSRTRTRRSAINAYAVFLKEYPAGAHAEAARARLAELTNGGEVK